MTEIIKILPEMDAVLKPTHQGVSLYETHGENLHIPDLESPGYKW
jgi:hypothetical protein